MTMSDVALSFAVSLVRTLTNRSFVMRSGSGAVLSETGAIVPSSIV